MTADEQPRIRYISTSMLLAYAWAYAFTVFATLVGLNATRTWPMQMLLPAVVFGYAALFALVVGFRPILIALIEDLGLREKMGLFVLHGLLFLTPKLSSPRATLMDCLIVLQVPLVGLLVKRESFLRLYAVNFLLVALSAFVEWQTEEGGFELAAALVVFVAGCFAADRFFLELDRYPTVAVRSAVRALLLGMQYAAAALAGGTLLYLVTPELTVVQHTDVGPPVVARPGGAQTFSLDALWEVAWQTFLLMIVIVVALALLQWLKKRYQGHEADRDSAMGGGVMKMVRKMIRPTPRPPQMKRGFSPREQILRGYWSWCDEMERFGLVRSPDTTPKEFAQAVTKNEGKVAAPTGELTRIFERAKYHRCELTRDDVQQFFDHSRNVIETLLASSKCAV